MRFEIRTHAITEAAKLTKPLDYKKEEFLRNGFTILEDVIPSEDLAASGERIENVYEVQAREIGGAECLKRMNDLDIARSVLAYDEFFLRFVTYPLVLSFLRDLLGPNITLRNQNAILNRPGKDNYVYSWHRDLDYQHFVCSRPLAVQALYCIDDFTEETGGTVILPGSHMFEEFPSARFIQNNHLQVSARAGSVIIMNAMVFHRAGNNTSSRIRRGLNHLFTIPLLAQQVSFPKMLQGRYAEDSELRKLLGYEWGPADSVLDWRASKLRKVA